MTFLPFLLTHWRTIATAAVIAALSLVLLLARADARHQAKLYAQEKAAHAQTVAGYRLATAQAQADDLAHAREVETRNAKIAEDTTNAYEAKLSDSAARYDRLRAQAAAYSGRQRDPDLPDTSEAACRAYAGTGCEGIPALLKAAQDNTDQLIGLQAWAAGVSVP